MIGPQVIDFGLSAIRTQGPSCQWEHDDIDTPWEGMAGRDALHSSPECRTVASWSILDRQHSARAILPLDPPLASLSPSTVSCGARIYIYIYILSLFRLELGQ